MAEVTGRPAATLRVLVVDDEPALVTIMVDSLRQAGYDAVGCSQPRRAADHPPDRLDVLLCDFRMPGIDGVELFGRLRGRFPDLVGVLATGFGNLPLVRQAMQAGFSGILLKPFPLDRIRAAVERAVAQRRLNDDNARLRTVLDVYAACQQLGDAPDHEAVARRTARLAIDMIGADRGAVLLAAANGCLQPPLTDVGEVPTWVAELAGMSLGAALADGLPDLACRTMAAVPLRCGDEPAGLLCIERVARPIEPHEAERLSLLADQAALVLVSRSLYERRLRDERLALVGRLAGAICERLRSPLRRIEQAMGEVRAGDEEYLAMIRQETHRLELMCMELADFVNGDDGTRRQPCSLRTMLDQVARRTRLAADPGVTIEVAAAEDVVYPADERKLSRAIQNLVKNGLEAMPDGGRLSLGVARRDDGVVIEVADTGCGMPPEVQAQVFEPFFTFGKAKGTGLGGAVVKSAVAAHHGRVELTSSPGVGTTFRLILPDPESVDEPESHGPNGTAAGPTGGSG